MKLAEVCETLGFDEEAAVYRKLLSDLAQSGIKGSRRAVDQAAAAPVSAARRGRQATSADARVNVSSAKGTRLVNGIEKTKPKKPALPIWR